MSAMDSLKSTPLQSPMIHESTLHSASEASFIFIRDNTSDHDSKSRCTLRKDDDANDDAGLGQIDLDRESQVESHQDGKYEASEDDGSGSKTNDIDDKSTAISGITEGEHTLMERTCTNLVSEKTEYLMSEQEIADWDKRMEETVDKLQKQQEDYEQWENKLKNRRLEAYERLKRLKSYHSQRVGIYNAIQNYLEDVNILLDNRSNTK